MAAASRHARCKIGGHAIDDYIVYFMKTYQPSEIRNFAIVGHASAGKTMLSEAMLVCGGVLNRLGSIAAGTTASLPLRRAPGLPGAGFSASSAALPPPRAIASHGAS